MPRSLLGWVGLALAAIGPLLLTELALRGLDVPASRPPRLAAADPSEPIFVRAGDRVAVAPHLRDTWRATPFPARPAPGALRLFAVGDSVTWGHRGNEFDTPLPAWPDVLERLLAARDDGGPHRVVNLGARTFGSGRVASVVRQVLAQEPDAILVNAGSSEHLEQDLLAEGARAHDRPAWLDELRIARLMHVWLTPAPGGLTLAQLRQRDEALRAPFVRPESLLRGEPDRAALLAISERNLRAIVSMCRERGVPLGLATVPANLRFPPFATRFEPDDAREGGEALIARTGALLRRGLPEEALTELLPAITAHPEAAGLHYREGQARDLLGDIERARTAYEQALESDACPARGLGAYNDLVRRLVRENPGILLFDQQRLFRDSVPDGIADDRLFLDHCHPTPEMQRRMAEEVLRVLDDAGWLAPGNGARQTQPPYQGP